MNKKAGTTTILKRPAVSQTKEAYMVMQKPLGTIRATIFSLCDQVAASVSGNQMLRRTLDCSGILWETFGLSKVPVACTQNGLDPEFPRPRALHGYCKALGTVVGKTFQVRVQREKRREMSPKGVGAGYGLYAGVRS